MPRKPPRVNWAPMTTDPAYPPYHPDNPANVGRMPVAPGHPGKWGPGEEGNPANYGTPDMWPENTYDNVTGNPEWPSAKNPPYRWDGSRWVRP